MTTDLITIKDLSSVQITTEARHRRNILLTEASEVEMVSTQEQNEIAAAVAGKLREFRLEVDKARKVVKKPVLDLGRTIESVADQCIGAISDEENRIGKLCGDFLTLELARARAAAKLLQPDLGDIEKRQQAALAQASSHEERDTIVAEFDEKIRDAQKAQQALILPKAEGQKMQEVWEFTILNILELANGRPDLVDIVPKRREIKEVLNQGFRIPGIKAWKEVRTR